MAVKYMKKGKEGIVRGYFRLSGGENNLQNSIMALIEAGATSGNLFFEREGTVELERLWALFGEGDTVVVLRLGDVCRNIDELIGLVRRLLLRGVVLKSVNEPWFQMAGDAMRDATLYQLIGKLYDLSTSLENGVFRTDVPERKPAGRPKGIRAECSEKLDTALRLYTERGELSVAEICNAIGLNERTFYRYLNQHGGGVLRRPKGRKAKGNARTY